LAIFTLPAPKHAPGRHRYMALRLLKQAGAKHPPAWHRAVNCRPRG